MISSEEQLRSAAERLGVEAEDLRMFFPSSTNLLTSRNMFDSGLSTAGALLQSEPIYNALQESRFEICERTFGTSPSQETSSAREHSTPPSPGLPNPTHDADITSSSPTAAATQALNALKAREILRGPCQNLGRFEGETLSDVLQGIKVPRKVAPVGISEGSLDESGKKPPSQDGNQIHPLPKIHSQLDSKASTGSVLPSARR